MVKKWKRLHVCLLLLYTYCTKQIFLFSETELKVRVSFLQNHRVSFNQSWHNEYFDDGEPHLFKWRALSFYKRKFLQNRWNLKIFFKINGPIFQPYLAKIILGWSEFKFVQMKGHAGLFPRGDNDDIAKSNWRNLKILFSRTTEPISTRFGTMHHGEDLSLFNWRAMVLSRRDNYEKAIIHQWNL